MLKKLGRNPKPAELQQNKRFMVRLTNAEKEAIEQEAELRAISPTEFLRLSGLINTDQFKHLVLPEHGQIPSVTQMIDRIRGGESLSQIAKAVGVQRHVLLQKLRRLGLSPTKLEVDADQETKSYE